MRDAMVKHSGRALEAPRGGEIGDRSRRWYPLRATCPKIGLTVNFFGQISLWLAGFELGFGPIWR